MGVSFDDGIKYIECDECQTEIRGQVANIGAKVYHPPCLPK